jgi:hypothetical protein
MSASVEAIQGFRLDDEKKILIQIAILPNMPRQKNISPDPTINPSCGGTSDGSRNLRLPKVLVGPDGSMHRIPGFTE